MTGLDRLRMYAQRMDELSVWPGGAELLDIAGQIEREQGERLMPEGCEWPRYESGDLVIFGDCVENRNGICTVNSVRFYRGGGVSVYGEDSGAQFVVVTEPVMRDPIRKANPKVIAADGEPLEVGQTVWEVDTEVADSMTVVDVAHDLTRCEYTCSGGKVYRPCLPPERLTHQRPVLDADGVPIKKGDTVWRIGGGEAAEVAYTITADASHPDEVVLKGYEDDWPVNADKLTHTKPEIDTWQLIEEDAGCTAAKYNERRGTIFTTKQQVARDLVRRCRALADRERGD